MTSTTKHVLALIGALVIGVAIYGAYLYPEQVKQLAIGSSSGATFNTAKTAMIVWNPQSKSASSTSILNSDSSDRIVKQTQFTCSGFNATFFAADAAGVANVNFTIATTAVSSVGLQGNSNFILSTNVATSATVSEVYQASTTPGGTATVDFRRWAAGSYLTVATNATSSAASCVIGVDYIAS